MQFAVPQFTDVEDKLIGPLTLKQFLILLAFGLMITFFYSLLKLSVFFFLFALPTGLLGLVLTFGKFNGRPVFEYALVFTAFVLRPQVRIFKREEFQFSTSIKTDKMADPVATLRNNLEEPNESRLKKLAYLLDQKTEEEKKIIDQETEIR